MEILCLASLIGMGKVALWPLGLPRVWHTCTPNRYAPQIQYYITEYVIIGVNPVGFEFIQSLLLQKISACGMGFTVKIDKNDKRGIDLLVY